MAPHPAGPQAPSCWSCAPRLSDEEYLALKGQVLRVKLAEAGHPVPMPQHVPMPQPYRPPEPGEERPPARLAAVEAPHVALGQQQRDRAMAQAAAMEYDPFPAQQMPAQPEV